MDCRTCHKPIPAARLVAIPNATQCVPCLTNEGDVDVYHGVLEVQGKALYEFHPVRGAAKRDHKRLKGIGSTMPVAFEFHPVAGKDFKKKEACEDGSKRGSGAEPGAIYTSGLGEKHSLSR